MTSLSWQGSVIDAPGSEPFEVFGDLVVAVRTPRSQDFVTVEVAPASECGCTMSADDQLVCSRPPPVFAHPWCGEVWLKDPVRFEIDGASYRLTLERLSDSPTGPPWVVCDVLVERV